MISVDAKAEPALIVRRKFQINHDSPLIPMSRDIAPCSTRIASERRLPRRAGTQRHQGNDETPVRAGVGKREAATFSMTVAVTSKFKC